VSWTTLALVLVAWCLVSVVAGFAFAFFFGGMTRIHPDELEKKRLERFRRDPPTAGKTPARRRGKGRVGARASYDPLLIDGSAHPPLEKG
jgi:hypothetical protein